MIDPFDHLTGKLSDLQVFLSRLQATQFEQLLALVIETNRHTNLTSVREAGEIVRRHFLEPAELGVWLNRHGLTLAGTRVLDLGSGAGFPGLPIKIVWPDIDLYLLEATGKKARFIETAVEALHLTGATVLAGRAETLARDRALREQFDVVLARAVAPMPTLVELSLPFLQVGGRLVAIKGSRVHEELSDAATALTLCGGEARSVEAFAAGEHLHVVEIGKTNPTPSRYPRHPGQPAAHPLA